MVNELTIRWGLPHYWLFVQHRPKRSQSFSPISAFGPHQAMWRFWCQSPFQALRLYKRNVREGTLLLLACLLPQPLLLVILYTTYTSLKRRDFLIPYSP